jgi:hypothetical protein
MRCRKCRRILTDPESIKLGYGPVCYENAFGKTKIKTKTSKMPSMKRRRVHKSSADYKPLLDDKYFYKEGGNNATNCYEQGRLSLCADTGGSEAD